MSLKSELSLDWDEEMATARPHDCVPLSSNHPLYVLYTSGTTGTPKVRAAVAGCIHTDDFWIKNEQNLYLDLSLARSKVKPFTFVSHSSAEADTSTDPRSAGELHESS